MYKFKVLGTGCTKCKKLYELVQKILIDYKQNTQLEYINDIMQIVELGILTTPALVLNDKVLHTGSFSEEQIKALIIRNIKDESSN